MRFFYHLTYLLSFSLLFHYQVFAQENGSLKGRVNDAVSGEALIGVSVQIEGSSQGGVTDANGNYQINDLTPGSKNLLFSMVGYNSTSLSVVVQAGKEVIVPNIQLEESSIGLDEIKVFADIVENERQAPTPIANITAQDIEERMGAQEFPEMLKSTPGVFVSTVGGSFGDARVRIRGFGSENTAVLINGIPVNDMETGRVFWSNWGGMNDITRNQQVQRGLGVTKLAVSSVGGTINIITKPTEQRKGVRLSYARSNRSWQDRIMLSASTGLMKGDWAVTVLGSTRQGQGFREGTDANSWAYFLSVYKRINPQHQIVLTAFGAPQTTNQGSNATQDVFDLVNNRAWNPAWGYRDGEEFSSRRNTYHKPKFMLNHYWDISEKTTLATSAYYSFGRGGGTAVNRTTAAVYANPVQRFLDPSDPRFARFQESGNSDDLLVPWDDMIAENRANNVSIFTSDGQLVEGNRANYIVQESRNDHNWFGALTTLNMELKENLDLTVGLDYRWYRGFHYQLVDDLLGADFWIDRERFNDQPNNNLLEPINTPKRVGDRIGYDYNGTVAWGGAFLQAEYTIRNLDIFATGTLVRTGFQRNGRFWHQEFMENSLGKSDWQTFNNFTFKAGANYRITGRHNVFVNAGMFTRAPFFRDAFVDNRVSNEIRGDLVNEEISSIEAGYGYRSARFAANLNVYRTSWQNRAYTIGTFSETYNDFVTFRMFNVGAIHQGIELDLNAQLTSTLSLTGMASIGDWRWDGNANAVVLSDPGLQVLAQDQTVYIDDIKVGGSAQTVAALGLRYRSPKFWYVGASSNYYDNLYSEYNPETRTNPEPFYNRVYRLPNAFTFDIYGGKSWRFSNGMIFQLKANINNITNNQFIIDSDQRASTFEDPNPSPFVQYYFGRTYFLSAVLNIR